MMPVERMEFCNCDGYQEYQGKIRRLCPLVMSWEQGDSFDPRATESLHAIGLPRLGDEWDCDGRKWIAVDISHNRMHVYGGSGWCYKVTYEPKPEEPKQETWRDRPPLL